jgi:hypothetical protein
MEILGTQPTNAAWIIHQPVMFMRMFMRATRSVIAGPAA